MSDLGRTLPERLNDMLVAAGLGGLSSDVGAQFGEYMTLLLRWNAKLNLTAIRDEKSILSRHFVESIACARLLPTSISTLLDFGSGAGFPGIPIALCRPEIAVTLAESQGKKATFLREAVRRLNLRATVFAGRAELLTSRFNCVTLRAVDRMPQAVNGACSLLAEGGWIAAMTTRDELEGLKSLCESRLSWREPIRLAGGDRRILALAVLSDQDGQPGPG
jgi:16S rRNA (guanine527-N7)-methyltransferase